MAKNLPARQNGLTAKQHAFVDEYLVDLNATQAAIRAGYSQTTAHVIGHENLSKPEIAAALAVAMLRRRERTHVDQDKVVRELACIAFADIRDLFTWDEERAVYIPSVDLTREQAAVIQAVKAESTFLHGKDGKRVLEKVKLELKTHSKLDALRELAKHLGIGDTLNLKGDVAINVTHTVVD
jgi:phage terminase small subunit